MIVAVVSAFVMMLMHVRGGGLVGLVITVRMIVMATRGTTVVRVLLIHTDSS